MRAAVLVASVLVVAGCVTPSGPTGGPPPDTEPDAEPPAPTPDEGSAPPLGAWRFGGSTVDGGRRAEGALDVTDLGVLWRAELGGAVTGTPTVADGRVFAATWKGVVVALDAATGEETWRVDAGSQVDASVTLWEDLAFFGTKDATLHAVDAATGKEAWKVQVDDTLHAHLYAQPLVVPRDGGATLVMGVASDQESRSLHGDAPVDFRGKVVAFDARTGEEKWRTILVPEGQTGAPVWATPVYDAAHDLLLVGTGNAYTAPAHAMTDAAVALRMSDGSVVWSDQTTKDDVFTHANPVSPDHDFGSTGAVVETGGRTLFVVAAKSSIVYAYDVETGERVWTNGKRSSGEGVIGELAAKDGLVVVPYVTKQKVAALHVGNGTTAWEHAFAGLGFADPAIAGDLVAAADTEGTVVVLDLATGAERANVSVGGGVFGGLSVVDGRLFVPTVGDGFLGDSGAVVALGPGGQAPSGTGPDDQEDAGLVRVSGFAFSPARLEVAPGTPVTWRNDDPQGHTVTSTEEGGFDLDLPAGATATWTFTESGTYAYYCRPHDAMVGEVVVD